MVPTGSRPALPGGYAIGHLVRIRCDEPLLRDTGPLGEKFGRYGGVIHCDQIGNGSEDPQAQLDADSAGIWGYYGHGIARRVQSPPGPPAEQAIPGSTLSKAVARELGRDGVRPDSVTCPALARQRGATATCKIYGKDSAVGPAKLHGTAQITIQDRAGHRGIDSFRLMAHGPAARGTGYPFDPETGSVLCAQTARVVTPLKRVYQQCQASDEGRGQQRDAYEGRYRDERTPAPTLQPSPRDE